MTTEATTTETEVTYTPEQLEFAAAMGAHRKQTGKLFPTWAEVLSVFEGLGYRRPDELVGDAPAGDDGEVCYSPAEMAFMRSMQEWKKANATLYPKWAEVMTVLLNLGWARVETSNAA